ncbi:hypothetical protein [Methylobacterium sp. yr668]|uniref:hypothetical protein n=1 Tax=Methylobacterium sp. yr668 TaxID=1761801 RepID=UPI0008E3ACE7|nr:hypothetical protein [Methylobacterium sp. yr668]SFT11024.1 hypothetical protein SAMN04487845_116114 [Methylobacterium sp. yr668]
MIAVSPLHAAISAHRAAYDAFQIAPEGEDSEFASCEMLDALEALVEAACAFPILGRSLPEGAGALLAHLQWWLTDEAVNATDYQPNYGILLGRAMDLAALLECGDFRLPQSGELKGSASGAYPTARPDPIFAALAAVEDADRRADQVLAETAGDESPEANARFEAEDRRRGEVEAMFASTVPTTLAGLAALVRRYVATASTIASEDLKHIARALAGVSAPEILPHVPAIDPIFGLIEAADAAATAHTVACRDLDEDDDAQMRACNQAAADAHDALLAVRQAMPVATEGLHALAAFYVRDAALYDRDGEHIEHLARAVIACESAGRFSAVRQQKAEPNQSPESVIPPGENRGSFGVPDQAEVETGWRSLSAETQDRIGIIATDMVFQAFVSGDAFGPKDQPVPGRSKRAQTIRGEASDASCQRLTELHTVVEGVLPALFGSAGQNPNWAVAMGAKR